MNFILKHTDFSQKPPYILSLLTHNINNKHNNSTFAKYSARVNLPNVKNKSLIMSENSPRYNINEVYWTKEGQIQTDLQRMDTSEAKKSSVNKNTPAQHKTVSNHAQVQIISSTPTYILFITSENDQFNVGKEGLLATTWCLRNARVHKFPDPWHVRHE